MAGRPFHIPECRHYCHISICPGITHNLNNRASVAGMVGVASRRIENACSTEYFGRARRFLWLTANFSYFIFRRGYSNDLYGEIKIG